MITELLNLPRSPKEIARQRCMIDSGISFVNIVVTIIGYLLVLLLYNLPNICAICLI